MPRPHLLTPALVLALSLGAHALSGTVRDLAGAPLPDIRVVLASTGASTWTDPEGVWSLGSPSSASRRDANSPSRALGMLRLEDGRLALHLGGRTIDGRIATGSPAVVSIPRNTSVAARSSSETDTLLFVHHGVVLARRATSLDLEPSIVLDLDTSNIDGAGWRRDRLYGTFRDPRDGRTYRTIEIGDITWMAENLDHQPPGLDIPWVSGSVDSGMKYGRLYTWTQALALADSCAIRSCSTLVRTSPRGLCPEGWHIPSEDDWQALVERAGGGTAAGLHLRSVGGWKMGAVGTDTYGMRLLGSGRRYPDGDHSSQGTDGFFWTRTENSRFDAVQRNLSYDRDYLYEGSGKTDAFAVRCIAD